MFVQTFHLGSIDSYWICCFSLALLRFVLGLRCQSAIRLLVF